VLTKPRSRGDDVKYHILLSEHNAAWLAAQLGTTVEALESRGLIVVAPHLPDDAT
jgi:hypothetical protein